MCAGLSRFTFLPAMRGMKLACWTKSLQRFPALHPKKRPDFPGVRGILIGCIYFSFVSVGSIAASVISKGSVSSWWYCRRSLLVAGALWCLTLVSALGQQKALAITTSSSAQEHTLRRGNTVQCIDRIFSSTSNVQQQEATHNAEIFVKAIHAGDLIRTCYCPIAVPDKRGSQRI